MHAAIYKFFPVLSIVTALALALAFSPRQATRCRRTARPSADTGMLVREPDGLPLSPQRKQ